MQKILVAVDGSEPSKEAFEYILEEAAEIDAEFTILQIVESFGYEEDLAEAALEREMKSAEEFTTKLKEQAEKSGVKAEAKVLTGPDPATEIAKYADEKGFDLVVVGSRGKTGLETVRLGSVSDAVIRRTGSPVMVVR